MTGNLPVVLCVDDDPRTLEILSKIMSRLPVMCVTARTPREALDLARRLRPQLLVLDLMLPEMSGWEVLDQIRSEAARDDLHVMIVTAKDAGYERLVAANVAQADVFLTKPFAPADVARHVLRLLGLPASAGWPGPD